MNPEIVIIAAIAKQNRVIGRSGRLPWHIPEDLKRFKRLTIGHPVIMGRKTFDSIITRNKQPLPGRPNFVLTRTQMYPEFPDVSTFPGFTDALNAANEAECIFVIGGESVYREALNFAHRLELTLIEGDIEGDAFFPEYESIIAERFKLTDERSYPGFCFVTYRRR